MSEPTASSRSTFSACAPATASSAINEKKFDGIDKFIGWRRLGNKDREKVMDNIASHENWKNCFSEIGPGPLLYATVRSIALDFIRRDKRRARREATVFAEADPSVEPQFEWEDEAQSALAAAVNCLPHDQREVIVLKIWNELTFSEIADALGISQNTAASRYRYALANLKKSLQPQ